MTKTGEKLAQAAKEGVRLIRIHRELQNRLGSWAVIHRLTPGQGLHGDLVQVSLRLTPGALAALQTLTEAEKP